MTISKSGVRKVLLVIGVNVAAVVLLVAAAELVLSFFVTRPVDTLVADPRLNHRIRPNSEETHREWISSNPEFPNAYTHRRNAQGWLEQYDVAKSKPPHTYRIFYVGDSFIEGTCEMSSSVPSIVESRLNNLAKAGDLTFEVINTGTSSYSPTIYYVLVRYILLDYNPDLIAVAVDMTDDFDDWKYSRLVTLDDAGNPRSVSPVGFLGYAFMEGEDGVVPATARDRTRHFLSRYSYTYNSLERVKARLGINGHAGLQCEPQAGVPPNTVELYQRWSWCKDEWDHVTQTNVNHTLNLLRKLAILCRERDVKLMFTAAPHFWQYAGNVEGDASPRWSSRPHDEIEKLAHEVGVPYLNSLEAMEPVVRGTAQNEFYYANNMHFNPRGYAAWANCHMAFLTDRKNALLPEQLLENCDAAGSSQGPTINR